MIIIILTKILQIIYMNIEELKKWIGSSEKSEDIVTSSLEQRFRATLDIDPGDPKTGDVASSGIHWTLAPPVYKHWWC